MPLYRFECGECGADRDSFHHHPDDLGAHTEICRCGSSMTRAGGFGTGNVWFEEARPRTILNLAWRDENGVDHIPTVTSEKEYREAKKKAGATEAGNRLGEKGVWI